MPTEVGLLGVVGAGCMIMCNGGARCGSYMRKECCPEGMCDVCCGSTAQTTYRYHFVMYLGIFFRRFRSLVHLPSDNWSSIYVLCARSDNGERLLVHEYLDSSGCEILFFSCYAFNGWIGEALVNVWSLNSNSSPSYIWTHYRICATIGHFYAVHVLGDISTFYNNIMDYHYDFSQINTTSKVQWSR